MTTSSEFFHKVKSAMKRDVFNFETGGAPRDLRDPKVPLATLAPLPPPRPPVGKEESFWQMQDLMRDLIENHNKDVEANRSVYSWQRVRHTSKRTS